MDKFTTLPTCAKTINQKNYISAIKKNIITFCSGPSGTGKTHIAIGMAINYLGKGLVDKIILSRPVIESGKSIGFLPGDINEKLQPYIVPMVEEMELFTNNKELYQNKKFKVIETIPLNVMRGRNFNNCFVVLDEMQNASYEQIKMVLTRIGDNCKMVLTGDISQTDIYHYNNHFERVIEKLINVEDVGIVQLTKDDIVRHPIVGKVLEKL